MFIYPRIVEAVEDIVIVFSTVSTGSHTTTEADVFGNVHTSHCSEVLF